ncbi:MAG: 50S ribosomal protein L16 [Synechococcales cyanobacterium]
MLSPKRTKFRKTQRGRMRGKACRGNVINFGEFALVAQEPCWITARQIEASRRAMTRFIKRGGQIWIRIFPDKSITMRPAETRMGSGKGNPEFWVAVVKPGRILFEMGGVTEQTARDAMRLAQYKLPIRTKFVRKVDMEGAVATETDSPADANEEVIGV